MKNINMIINGLWNAFAIKAEEGSVMKDGVQKRTIMIDTNQAAKPIFYPDDMEGDEFEIAICIAHTMEHIEMPNFNTEPLKQWDTAKGDLKLGIRQPIDESDVLTKNWLDLQLYVYYPFSEDARTKITHQMLDVWGVNAQTVFAKARTNTLADMRIGGLYPMMIIGTNALQYGASLMTIRRVMDKACDSIRTDKIYIIPSSIHEVLAIDYHCIELSDVQQIVREVNADRNVMREEDVLCNTVYLYDKAVGRTVIA